MLVPTEALVLRTIKYGNTSVIASLFTRELGLQRYIVQGVRNSKARTKANLLQPSALLDIVAYNKPNANLQHLREFGCNTVYTTILFDVYKSSVAFYMMELLAVCVKEEETNKSLFDFVKKYLVTLDTMPFNPLIHVHFTVHLTELLGFSPDADSWRSGSVLNLQEGTYDAGAPSNPYYLNPESTKNFAALQQVPYEKMQDFTMPYNMRISLLNDTLQLYALHVAAYKTLRTLKVLEEVLR